MMQKYKILFLALLFIGVTQVAFGQKKKEAPAPEKNDQAAFYQKVYEQGLRYNDLAVSTQAVHGIIAADPEATHWLDTLATLYFQRGAFAQCLLTSTEALQNTPGNQTTMEMAAVSKENLGLLKEALADYEQLYSKSQNIFHMYQISTIQYGLRRFGECEQTVNRLLADPKGKEETILINSERGQQRVPFYAACQNLLGVLMLDLGKQDMAKKHFDQAILIYPEFALAKANLLALSKK